MTWDWEYAASIVPDLLVAAWLTVVIALISTVIALSGGLAIAIVGWNAPAPVRRAIALVIDAVRGIPVLVLLFFVFYALPRYGVLMTPFLTGVLVLGGAYAAYSSEVYRGGLASLPQSVWDACHALGLPRRTTWVRVVIPMVVRSTLGSLGNYVVILYKQTSLLVAIGAPVLLTVAQSKGYASYRYLEPYTLAGLLYLVLNIPTVFALRAIERRVGRGGF
jgi:polar amino acid transport system permease protein